MARFLTGLEVEELAQDRWRLLAPLVYETDLLTAPGNRVVVPTGFETDLESIPRVLPLTYAILYGTAHKASVVHDLLYSMGSVPRKMADAILYEAIVCTGEPRWKAWAIWLGVRVGGWVAWNRHRAEKH